MGVAVSALLLWWSLRGVRWPEVRAELAAVRLLPLLAAIAVATSTFALRAIRWRGLLRRPDGGTLPWGPRWHATAIGFTANNILPLRAGELARAWAVTRLGGVGFVPALTSLVVERLFDLFTLIASLGLGLLLSDLPATTTLGGQPIGRAATVMGAAALAALATGIALVLRPAWGERALARLVPFAGLRTRLLGLFRGVVAGLAPLGDPRALAVVVLWSLAVWGANALSFHLTFIAFDIPVGFGGALLLQALLAFGVAVPSTPGYAGVFEAVIVAALSLYAVPRSLAFAYAVTYHVTTFVPIVVLGCLSLARTPMSFADLRRPEPA